MKVRAASQAAGGSLDREEGGQKFKTPKAYPSNRRVSIEYDYLSQQRSSRQNKQLYGMAAVRKQESKL